MIFAALIYTIMVDTEYVCADVADTDQACADAVANEWVCVDEQFCWLMEDNGLVWRADRFNAVVSLLSQISIGYTNWQKSIEKRSYIDYCAEPAQELMRIILDGMLVPTPTEE